MNALLEQLVDRRRQPLERGPVTEFVAQQATPEVRHDHVELASLGEEGGDVVVGVEALPRLANPRPDAGRDGRTSIGVVC